METFCILLVLLKVEYYWSLCVLYTLYNRHNLALSQFKSVSLTVSQAVEKVLELSVVILRQF